MNKILLIILCVFPLDLIAIQLGEGKESKLFDSPITSSVYWLDTIELTNYTVVESGINHQRFLIQDSSFQVSKKKEKFWKRKSFIIYFEDVGALSSACWVKGDAETTQAIWDDMWPWKKFSPHENNRFVKRKHWEQSSKDVVCEFDIKPKLFRRFLFKGSFYNYVSAHNCIDCTLPNDIDFKDETAYYCVLIPVK